MIIGVGIDMIEVERVLEKINRASGFREKIFSAREIAYCESQPAKGENYAARFAAKEAFLKASGAGLTLGYALSDIELVNDANGKPELLLGGEWLARITWNKIHVSVSHLKNLATAIVILEK